MTNAPLPQPDEVLAMLQSIRRRMRVQTVAIIIMALALMLTAAAVFGSLVNYFAGDPMVFGSLTAGAAILGFVCGWIARRRA